MKPSISGRSLVLAVAAAVCLVATTPALATFGYWDLFSVSLSRSGAYWNNVNAGGGVLGDPLVAPDPAGVPIVDTTSPLADVAWAYGGFDWGTSTLESDVSVYNINDSKGGNYTLNVILDSSTIPNADSAYPSWGSINNIVVQPEVSPGVYGAAIPVTNWTVSPLSPAGGTTVVGGLNSSIGLGALNIGSPEGGIQPRAIYGAAAALPPQPAGLGYRVGFSTNLQTWDSYNSGAGAAPPPFPTPPMPPAWAIPGKEYSNLQDTTWWGAPDPLQNINWDTNPCTDTFDFTSSGVPDLDVDAMANIGDAFFSAVIQDQVPMLTSFKQTPLPNQPPHHDGNIYFQTPGLDVNGIWRTPPQINPTSPPNDVDGLEVWGPLAADDANCFSLVGDPGGVAVWQYFPGAHQVQQLFTTAQLQQAIGTPEPIDVDAMMVFSVAGQNQIMFSIAATQPFGGAWDGGEIWVWDGINPAQFLVHGGQIWNTAYSPGQAFGTGTDEIDALEAIGQWLWGWGDWPGPDAEGGPLGDPTYDEQIAEFYFPHVEGDLNGNGVVDGADANLITDWMMSEPHDYPDYDRKLDVNGDGEVNCLDVEDLVFGIVGTVHGDADLDGDVDINDLSVLASNWNGPGPLGWGDGDFNCDGQVNINDLSLLAANWGFPYAAANAPEPATMVLLAMGGVVLLRRRR